MDYELGVWVLCNQEERARRLASGPCASGDTHVSDPDDRDSRGGCFGDYGDGDVSAETFY